MTQKIAFFDAKPYDQEIFDTLTQESTEHTYQIKYFKNRLTPDSALMARGFPVVCAFVNDDLSAPVLDTLYEGGTRLIALRCAGYNNVDLAAAYGRIHVVRVPAYSPHAVAEHALAMMMSLNRRIPRAAMRTRDANFSLNGLLGFDMYGKTAGIIGTGRIGMTAAAILKGIGMKVLLYDRYPNKEAAQQQGCTYVDLETLYRESDIITLHCPLTPETHHMINRQAIDQMKPGVMIINTGRGKLIDTKALIQGLKTRKIGAAGLDVYEEEDKYFFEDFSSDLISDDTLARLLSFNNVLVTSHQAFFTREAVSNIAQTTLSSIAAFTNQAPLDKEVCYRCDQKTCRHEEKGRCFPTP